MSARLSDPYNNDFPLTFMLWFCYEKQLTMDVMWVSTVVLHHNSKHKCEWKLDGERVALSPKAPAPGWAVDSYKMVIVNKRESRFLDIKYS